MENLVAPNIPTTGSSWADFLNNVVNTTRQIITQNKTPVVPVVTVPVGGSFANGAGAGSMTGLFIIAIVLLVVMKH